MIFYKKKTVELVSKNAGFILKYNDKNLEHFMFRTQGLALPLGAVHEYPNFGNPF